MPSRRARTNTFSAGITWKEVRRSLTGFLTWFLRVTWFIDYINPLRIYTRWRRRGCVHDCEGNVVIFRQTLLQRIRDSFVTESSRRRRLLDWVQSLVPAMDINDFSASWTNGVALCALLDALVPGACPELARLKPYHKLNNIRLALKLANKFFALPLTAFRAEEIAIYGNNHQRRVYELLTVIRMLHVRACAAAGGGGTFGRAPKDAGNTGVDGGATPASDQDQQTSSSMVYCRNIARLCRVRKSGYQTGTVGKVYTFDVWFPDGLNPDVIHVEVVQLEEKEAVDGFLLDDERSESVGNVLGGIPGDLQDLKMDEGASKFPEQMGAVIDVLGGITGDLQDEEPSKFPEQMGAVIDVLGGITGDLQDLKIDEGPSQFPEQTGDVMDVLGGIPGELQDLKMDEGPSQFPEQMGDVIDVLSGNPGDLQQDLKMDEGPSEMEESSDQKQLRSVEDDSSIVAASEDPSKSTEEMDETSRQKLSSVDGDSSGKHVPTSTSSGENNQKEERGSVEKTESEETKPKVIPVDRSMENGLLRVSFCPAFVGRYQVSAMFGKVDVEGSPMVVSVSPDFGSQSWMDESSRKRLTFAEAAEIIIAKARNSRIYRQMLQNERAPSKNSLYDVAAAVLRRTSKVKRTLAFRGGHSQSIINSEKAVVKRRKILKQMITRGGQEIVIERAASTSIDDSMNRMAATGNISGSSELSGNSVNVCPSLRVDDAATDGGKERSSDDGKQRCFLVVPRPDDAVFRCSPMSPTVEKPQRGDLFETEDTARRSAEPDKPRVTSSDHPQDLENQEKTVQHDEDPAKDGAQPVSGCSTAQAPIEVPENTEIAADKPAISALGNMVELDENRKPDGQAEHSSLDGSVSETDARRRRNQFRASSVRETSLAKHHRESVFNESDNRSLLGSNLLDCNIENMVQGTPGSLSFDEGKREDRVNDSNKDSLIPFLLPTNRLESDNEIKGKENEKHWSLLSTPFDHTTTDYKLTPKMISKDNFIRQEAVPSTGPDVHNTGPDAHNTGPDVHNTGPDVHNTEPDVHNTEPDVHNTGPDVHNTGPDVHKTGPDVPKAIVSPQKEGSHSSITAEDKDSRSMEPAEVESQSQSTTSKEPWTLATPPSLPVVSTMDRWTQVMYDEIKEETGWKRPTRRVSPRKRIGMTQETKPIQHDKGERTPNFKGPESNSGNESSQRSSRKSRCLNDTTNTEHDDMKTPCTEDSSKEELPAAKTDDTKPSDPPVNSFKAATRRRRRRRDVMDQSKEGLRSHYPQSPTEQLQNTYSTSGYSKRVPVKKTSYNSYPSMPNVQLHPVKHRRVSLDSFQQLGGTKLERKSLDGKDRMEVLHDEGIDRGSIDSEGRRHLSELRKLDDFFVFLDQFSNGDNDDISQKSRDVIVARRSSAESTTKERRSTLGSQYKCSTRDDVAATATSDNDDFLFAMFGNIAGEDVDVIPGSSDNQIQSLDGEMWVDVLGGGDGRGGEVDVEDVTRFYIYRMCTAFGPGLNEGTVGRLNYFQVRILTKRQGHLTVEMSGHRRHSVLEQNVTYIGDNVYDVTYEVSSPGVYAIAVKWANCHVRGSPFVCTVSM